MQSDPTNSNEMRTELIDLINHVSYLKKNYQTLYDGLPDLLRTVNADGIILDCNKAYAEHMGYTKKELVGTSIFMTVAEENLDAMRNSLEDWKRGGSVRNRKVWFKRKDGTKFLGLVSANTMYDDNGKVIGSNTSIRDITDIYQTQKKLGEFKEKNFEKDQFINMITGDLKSSAIHMTNFLKVLTAQDLGIHDTHLIDKLNEVKSRARSMVKILSDIQEMQKIENGELVLYKSQNNLSKLINDVILKLKDEADSHRCSITTELVNDFSLVFDKNRIEEVLIQILTNAIDFSPRGEGKVHVKLEYQNEYAKIIVKDNGIGIQSGKLDKIFEKFHRMEARIILEYGGAGLGLYICKTIVEGHNGKIWAESKGAGTGSEIHILLPLFSKDSQEIRKI